MAYITTILRVSQDFAGLGWVCYDAAFRRVVAVSGDTKWSEINPTLYAMFFIGATRAAARCDLCMATSHRMTECALFGHQPSGFQDRPHFQASSETTPSAAILWAYKAFPIGRNLSPMEQQQLYLCEVSSHPYLHNLSREPPGYCLSTIQPAMAAWENSSSPQQSVVTVLPCPVMAAWTGSVTYLIVVYSYLLIPLVVH